MSLDLAICFKRGKDQLSLQLFVDKTPLLLVQMTVEEGKGS